VHAAVSVPNSFVPATFPPVRAARCACPLEPEVVHVGRCEGRMLPAGTTKLVSMRNQIFWSWRRDLNPRPPDYKSGALPAELRQPAPHPATCPGNSRTRTGALPQPQQRNSDFITAPAPNNPPELVSEPVPGNISNTAQPGAPGPDSRTRAKPPQPRAAANPPMRFLHPLTSITGIETTRKVTPDNRAACPNRATSS
jgi:hypothetical protein